MAEIKTDDGKKEKYLLYYDGETVSGKVSARPGEAVVFGRWAIFFCCCFLLV